MQSLVGDVIIDSSGKEFKGSSLDGQIVGIYFSGHWCPPCRQFTPILAKVYRELTAAGKPFEVVFVSSDRDQPGFNKYMASMPWKAIPFDRTHLLQSLGQKYKVKGIPMLVLLDPSGQTLTTDGRTKIMQLGASGFPWGATLSPPRPSASAASKVSEAPLLADELAQLAAGGHKVDFEHYPGAHHGASERKNLSVKELRKLLQDRDIDSSDCIEKEDFIRLCLENGITLPTKEESQEAKSEPMPEPKPPAKPESIPEPVHESEEDLPASEPSSVGSEYPSDASKPLEKMSIAQLRQILKERNLDYSDCIEKADFVQKVIDSAPA